MKFLRHCLFALVLLRLLTGVVWAMPSMPMLLTVMADADFHAAVPCHETADQPPQQSDGDHASTPCSPLCHMCCMGCGPVTSVLHAPTARPRHARPAHLAQDVARWQHVPDLRPPI